MNARQRRKKKRAEKKKAKVTEAVKLEIKQQVMELTKGIP